MDRSGHHEREHFFGAAKMVAGITVLSRVLGLVRDVVIIGLGANRATDAFWMAFSVPNLFRRLFGEGALSAAFVPVFTEVAEAEGWDKARLVLANTVGLLAVVLAVLVVLLEVGLAACLVFAPGRWDRTLLVQLLMVVMPFMFTICLLALGSAALNCKGHFAYPAFAPIILNIGLIAAAWLAHRLMPGEGFGGLFLLSGSVIVAGVVQLAGVIWLLRRGDLAAVPRLRPVLAPVRRMARLVLPMIIPLGVLQFSAFFDRLYAWIMTAMPEAPRLELLGLSIAKPLAPGVVTCLYAANRLYQFPLGILAISLATAVFPLLSRYASRGDIGGLREVTNRALRLSLFLGVPAGVGLIILARPIILLIYRHGRFSAEDAARAAFILQMYSVGMWAYFCNHILLRAFFSQKDTSTPLRVSCALVVANIILVVLLVFTPLQAGAFGLATAATSSANAILLVLILRRRWGHIGAGRILRSIWRIAVAAGVMAGTLVLARGWLGAAGRWLSEALGDRFGPWLDSPVTARAVLVLGCLVVGGGVYLLVAMLLRCPELGELRGPGRAAGKAPAEEQGPAGGTL